MAYLCDSCGYEWIPKRNFGNAPETCPVCSVENWDQAPEAMSAPIKEFVDSMDKIVKQPTTTVDVVSYSFTDKVKSFFKRLFGR